VNSDLWHFLPVGYVTTIAIETPILLLLLSRAHSVKRRLLAGIWLTACTYPIVVLVLPVLIPANEDRWLYLLIAETFAPVAECVLFAAAFHAGSLIARRHRMIDFVAITVANLASFGIGEILNRYW
jgi:hypothetical protein